MKLEDFWQENKSFVVTVVGGAVLFGAGWATINSTVGDELAKSRVRLTALEKQLAEPKFTEADQQKAQAERDKLAAAVDTLTGALAFQVRPDYELAGQAPSSRYFAVQAKAREELLALANRAGLVVPESLGLPNLSPTKEQEIVRDLEALDVIDRVVHLAIEAQCERIDEIHIKLDPRLVSGKPITDIEKTTVEFDLVGPAAPLCKLIALSQQKRATNPLLVDRVGMTSTRAKNDESKLEIAFLVAHLHGDAKSDAPKSDSPPPAKTPAKPKTEKK